MIDFPVGFRFWMRNSDYRQGSEPWKLVYVIAVTARSYVVSQDPDRKYDESERWQPWTKVPKNRCHKSSGARALFTDEEKAEAVWLDKHGRGIRHLVDRCQDPKTMRRIAELVGYEE